MQHIVEGYRVFEGDTYLNLLLQMKAESATPLSARQVVGVLMQAVKGKNKTLTDLILNNCIQTSSGLAIPAGQTIDTVLPFEDMDEGPDFVTWKYDKLKIIDIFKSIDRISGYTAFSEGSLLTDQELYDALKGKEFEPKEMRYAQEELFLRHLFGYKLKREFLDYVFPVNRSKEERQPSLHLLMPPAAVVPTIRPISVSQVENCWFIGAGDNSNMENEQIVVLGR